MQFTLVQYVSRAIGQVPDHASWLIPNERVSPALAELMPRLNGQASDACDKRDLDLFWTEMEAVEDCATSTYDSQGCPESQPVVLRDGDSIVRLCQIFVST